MAAAMKLGELLVQEGVITPHQLEEALKYQVIFGGKLGTNLIELDFVKEDDIAKMLSRMLRVPLVSGEQLQNIPDNVVKLIPRDIAEQHQVVPLSLDNRKLTLVMANPSDLKAIDEIAFRTGLIIRPAVAAEVRLILALEKYYHIPREIRYVQVSKKVESDLQGEIESGSARHDAKAGSARPSPAPDKKAEEKKKKEAEQAQARKKAEAAAEEKTRVDAKAKADAEAEAKRQAEAKKKQTAEPEENREKTKPEAPDSKPASASQKPARTIRFEDDEDDEPAAEAPEEVVELPEADIVEEGAEEIEAYGIEEVFKHLADPADREDIADSLITHLGHQVDRAALFQIRGQAVQGWKLFVDDKPKTDFGMFQVTLDHPSILKTVIDTASYYIGPIPKTSPDNMRLIESMGGNPPASALLMPVIVMGRVVTVIYIDDKKADLPQKLLDIQKMAAKMAMSFEILILKNKILMM